MAKKKARRAAPAKGGNALWWIVAIVVIILVAWFYMKPAAPTTGTQAAPEKGALTTSTAPEMLNYCNKLLAIGVEQGTLKVVNNIATVEFKNSGKVAIEGTYFEFIDNTGKAAYKKNADNIDVGAKITYTVDLAQVGTELGSSVKTFVLYPVEGGKACKNQRRIVIADVAKVST